MFAHAWKERKSARRTCQGFSEKGSKCEKEAQRMARIPEGEIERLKRRVETERHGADLVGLCPFHEDHSPSLVISPRRKISGTVLVVLVRAAVVGM